MPQTQKQPKIGLALSGGGVRAFIHIGFYEVLKEHNIPISFITGTSMGAIVGAAMALGYDSAKLREFAMQYKNLDLFSLKNFNYFDESIVKRETIKKIIDNFFGKKTFANLKIPFKCTAVDLENEKEVVLDSGLLSDAVQASSAYPLIFPPMFYKEKYLIDGGLLDQVPALLTRQMGADKLVVINIRNNMVRQYISGHIYSKYYHGAPKQGGLNKIWGIFRKKKGDFKLLIDIVIQSIEIASRGYMLSNLKQAKPDLLLEPLIDIGLLDFHKMEQAIEEGRKLAISALPKIEAWTRA